MTRHIAIVGRHFDFAAGLGTLSRGLVDHLPQAGGDYRYTIFTNEPMTYQPPKDIAVEVVKGYHPRLNPREQLFAWEQSDVRKAVQTAKPDLVHWLHPAASLIKAAKPTVITVCDMIPYVTEGYLPNKATKLYAAAEKLAMQRADHLITISEFSKREIVDIAGIPPSKITVTYLAGPAAQSRTKAVLDGRYVLFLGGSERRKNPTRVIEAFAEAQLPDDVRLAVAGNIRDSFIDDDVRASVAKLPAKIRDRITLLGKVSDADLVGLYAHATAFAFPSLSEGFGLPVLEAMAYGVPVLTSNVSSLPEVAGDAAVEVDPTDIKAMSQALQDLVTDETLRARLVKAGPAHAQTFTWEQTARQTVAVYDQLLGGARG